jgi:ribosomal protein S18 acetylase RimI-like enzyme
MALPIEIRRLTLADVDAAMELAAALPGAPQWPQSSYEFATASSPDRTAFAAVAQSAGLAGFVFTTVVPPHAELESVAVAPAFQRRGIARQLMISRDRTPPQLLP